MEFVKTFLVAVAICATYMACGQYSEKVLKAFENSYIAEKENDFNKAASVLKKNYLEDSYEFDLRLGWLYYKMKKYDESKIYYRKALTLLPYSEEAKFGLILPLSAKNEWDEVVQMFNGILENSPTNSVALYRLGLIYYDRKDWTQANKCFQKVVDLYPFGYDGLLMLAWTNLQQGKVREAKILFNKVILYSPGDKSALDGLKLLN